MPDPKLKNVRSSAAPSVPSAASGAPALPAGQMVVTDTRGRAIVVKRLHALDKMRLSRIVGGDGTLNQAYFGYALLAASVVSIDGEPEPFPKSIIAIESMVDQLDDDGLEVVSTAVGELNGGSTAAEELEAAKN